jgi:hypothetical protein
MCTCLLGDNLAVGGCLGDGSAPSLFNGSQYTVEPAQRTKMLDHVQRSLVIRAGARHSFDRRLSLQAVTSAAAQQTTLP